MQVMTEWFGPLDVDPDTILTFPAGLPGLEQCTRFKLLYDEGSAQPQVRWLQSLDQPEITFSVVDPSLFGVSYELTLSDEECALLECQHAEQIAILMLLGRNPETRAVEPKVKYPILLNLEKRRGYQKPATRCELVFKNI